jgi:hypothetical protein
MEAKFLIIPLAAIIMAYCPPRRNAPNGNAPNGVATERGAPDCSNLTKEEQLFIEQLSSLHAHIFCEKFSPIQRAEAMAKVTMNQSQQKGITVTPDEAVEMVLRETRGQPIPPSVPSQPPVAPEQKPKNLHIIR